jgi:carbon storage regulator CsrA
MIVFRRKKREQIIIDGNIIVTVMHIRGTRVSLGIQAPDGMKILRTELTPYEVAALPLVDANVSETPLATPVAT